MFPNVSGGVYVCFRFAIEYKNKVICIRNVSKGVTRKTKTMTCYVSLTVIKSSRICINSIFAAMNINRTTWMIAYGYGVSRSVVVDRSVPAGDVYVSSRESIVTSGHYYVSGHKYRNTVSGSYVYPLVFWVNNVSSARNIYPDMIASNRIRSAMNVGVTTTYNNPTSYSV